jgi:peptide/nickel transport system permease protein
MSTGEESVVQAEHAASDIFSTRKPQSQFSIVVRQLRRNRGAVIGLIIVLILIFVAIFAPWIAPYDPLDNSIREALQPPSRQHLLGTDELGRDLLSRLIFGARISLRVGLIAVAIAGGVGVTLGTVAGFYGGWLDEGTMRLIDILMAFPGMLLALMIITILGPGLTNVMIAVGIGSIPSFTRVARGATLTVRSQDYILAAQVVGCGSRRIITRYIVPNILPSIIVLATLRVATAILAAAGLSFLGLGAQPPSPEWGAILNTARTYLRRAWWFFTFPGLAIMITVLSMNLFGDGVRDALDPRLRR